ncbi:sensor histidine kinase [Actinoalloteichus hymeniacidonis]|uniref:Signal transduction histidine kinase n=1 Tax=Actinoalloteichus hymeniacidonis TaxID=340345 RepID=A0AAC9HMH4_9PSEU|nr:histidine kinase [Actinoalloteichus hymeniacidonis]AOS61928.1 signal transduction histidine kinase [Actinoalloteichus hymeniacidonis]MBB5910052.1 two-component system sensor histidine kinase DesK [Actinoalloteichus hymeniacidonis]
MIALPKDEQENPSSTRGRLRRLNVISVLAALGPAGILLVAVESQTWVHAAILSAGVAAGLLAAQRWAMGDLERFAVPCLVVTLSVWVAGAFIADAPSASYGTTILAPLVISALPRHRVIATVGFVAFAGLIGLGRLLVTEGDTVRIVVFFAFLPAVIISITTGLMAANRAFMALFEEVEQAREREGEVAVARERARFASDLHDIQGHTLHVVKLKVALAEKLVRVDVDRAAEELREVHALVGDTIKQTKELAYAQRQLNLSAELENAKNLFEAAGIRVRVTRQAEVDPGVSQLLGQVLRETTTNILRHAEAKQVRITLSAGGIVIVNDGAPDEPLPNLRGLATLRERLAGSGGELDVQQQDGSFHTIARFPNLRRTAETEAGKNSR